MSAYPDYKNIGEPAGKSPMPMLTLDSLLTSIVRLANNQRSAAMRVVFADIKDDGEPSELTRAIAEDEEAAYTNGRVVDVDFPHRELVELLCAMAILLFVWTLMALIFAKPPQVFYSFVADLVS